MRVRGLVAPVVLGAIGFLPALALALPGSTFGRRHPDGRRPGGRRGRDPAPFGALTAGTYLLLTLAAAVLSPYSAFDRPESVLPWAAALLLVALATRGISAELAPVRRWDLPPFAVAHAVVLLGLAQAVKLDELAVTWIGAGALALAVALVLRAPPGVPRRTARDGRGDRRRSGLGRPGVGGCSVGVALVAAKLPAKATAARTGLQAVAALAGGGALVELGRFLDWSMTGLAIAGLLLAALATVAGLVAWATRPGLPWAGQAGAFAVAFNLLAAGAASSRGRIALRSSGCSSSWQRRRPAPASCSIAARR